MVDKNDRFVTGLTLVMSSADSHVPTSRLPPAEVEVGMGRPIRRSFGRQPYKSPSIYEEKASQVWGGREISPQTKEREVEMVHVVSP